MTIAIVIVCCLLVIGGVIFALKKMPVDSKPPATAPVPDPIPSTPPVVVTAPKPPPVVMPVEDMRWYVRVIKGASRQANGLQNLVFELRSGDKLLDSVVMVSGAPGMQVFLTNDKRPMGEGYPIGENYYKLGKPEWKGSPGDYSASWGAGLGPMWIAIRPIKGEDVNVYGVHLDSNKEDSPGSNGCVTAQLVDYLKTIVSWWNNPQTAPELMVVNWGLGTVETKGMGYKSFNQPFDAHELSPWEKLLGALKKSAIEFPALKSITLAQWILESGRGTSPLSKAANNFGGIKFRDELLGKVPGLSKFFYDEGRGEADKYYCKLETPDQYIGLYWAFIARAPYNGWRDAAAKGPEEYLRFIANAGYMGGPSAPAADKEKYVQSILQLWPEARKLLGESSPVETPAPVPAGEQDLKGLKLAIDVGHGMWAEEGGGDDDPGAVDNGFTEHALNLVQALEIKRILELRGAAVDVYCYEKTMTNQHLTLGEKGEKGKGHHIFLSLHHNGLDGRGPMDANYSCTMLSGYEDGSMNTSRHTAADKAFALAVAKELGLALGYGLSDNGGLLCRPLGIFSRRLQTWSDCKVCCLCESYFIDANELQGKNMNVISKYAAAGIAKAVANYAKEKIL